MPVRIITDSTSEITLRQAEELGITVIPLSVTFGEKTYLDGVDISLADFYARLENEPVIPTTSHPAPDAIRKEFEHWLSRGYEVLGLFISSGMSGTYQAVRMACEGINSPKIHLVDTLNLTIGLQAIVLRAIELVNAGKGGAEAAAIIEDEKKDMRMLAIIPTLKYLVKSGRVSTITGKIGNLLNLKPIMTIIDGVAVNISKTRGMEQAMDFVIEYAKKKLIDLSRPVVIGYTQAPETLKQFVQRCQSRLGLTTSAIAEIGPTVGSHTGFGSVGIAYFEKR